MGLVGGGDLLLLHPPQLVQATTGSIGLGTWGGGIWAASKIVLGYQSPPDTHTHSHPASGLAFLLKRRGGGRKASRRLQPLFQGARLVPARAAPGGPRGQLLAPLATAGAPLLQRPPAVGEAAAVETPLRPLLPQLSASHGETRQALGRGGAREAPHGLWGKPQSGVYRAWPGGPHVPEPGRPTSP